MNTTEFLEREIRRAEISLRHAQRKPHTPKEELRGLRDKIACLEEALTAVQRRCLAEKPMTLEQLREMDGEPVWIVEHPDWGHWELSADAEDYIADRDQDLYGLQHDDPAGQCGLHVLGWLAYRRPPEGEEET